MREKRAAPHVHMSEVSKDINIKPRRSTPRDVCELYVRHLLSIRQIASRVGISRTAVRMYLVDRRVPIHTKSELSLFRRQLHLPADTLKELYQQNKFSANRIASKFGCSSQHVVDRLKELDIPVRDAVDASTLYRKVNFSGDRVARAYLLGFRTGDLHVKRLNPGGRTIWIETASTHPQQINLVQELFRTYGRCWVGRPKQSGARGVHVLVNETFSFLLPKLQQISPWILRQRECFLAFLAGYVDAEGHFAVYGNNPIFAIQSYDHVILTQIAVQLRKLGVQCRDPWIAAQPGDLTNANGYSNRSTVWRLQVAKRHTLWQIIQLLKPYLRHKKRQRDMRVVEHYLKKHLY